MMNPSPFGASFDPTRQQTGPQGSTPGQALQIISTHVPKLQGLRGIPNQLMTAPSHVGQTPEALVLSSLLRASQSAGTPPVDTPPGDGVTDLLKFIEDAMGQGRTPSVTPGGAPPAPTPGPMAPPSYAPTAPRVTPSDNFQHGPGLGPHAPGGFSLPTPFGGGSGFGRA